MDKGFISKLYLVVLLGVLILLFRLFWTYISAIALGLLIASAFYPVYYRVKRFFKFKDQTAALIMTFVILLVLVVPVGSFIGTLSTEAFDFYERTRDSVSLYKIYEGIQGDSPWMVRTRKVLELSGIELTPETIESLARSLGRSIGLFLSRQASSVASNLMSFLLHFFLMMLVIFYILRDGPALRNYVSELIPFPSDQQEKVVNKFREMGRAIIFGNGLSGFIQGILGGFGFYISDLGSPILWGTVIGIMAFLPIIGASIVFIPATFLLFLHGKPGLAIFYLGYNVFYSSIIEYLIKPRLIGKGMQMNPLLVFIGIFGGLKLFGLLGIIYGPLIMTIFFTLAEIYKMEYKETMC